MRQAADTFVPTTSLLHDSVLVDSCLLVDGRLVVGDGLDPRRHPPFRLADTLRAGLAHLRELLLGSLEGRRQSRHGFFQREGLEEKDRSKMEDRME